MFYRAANQYHDQGTQPTKYFTKDSASVSKLQIDRVVVQQDIFAKFLQFMLTHFIGVPNFKLSAVYYNVYQRGKTHTNNSHKNEMNRSRDQINCNTKKKIKTKKSLIIFIE